MPEDYLLIATDIESKFVVRFLCLKQGATESLQLHKVPKALQSMYSQFLISSVLLGSRADDQESTLYKLKFSNNPIALNCEVSPMGPYRSAIFPPQKKEDYKEPSAGEVLITKLFKNNQVYQSSFQIQNSDLLQGFSNHMQNSEQRDCHLIIHVNQNKKQNYYGLWLERLPDTSLEDWADFIKRFEDKNYFSNSFAKTADPDEIIQNLFPRHIKILAVTKPKLHCTCNKDRVLQGLKALPTEDLTEIFMEGKGIESQCDYCHKVWTVTDKDIKKLIQSSSTVH